MDLQVHLDTLNLRNFIGALERLFRVCEPASITCSAPYDGFVRSAAIIDSDTLGREHARCVPRSLVEFERLTTQT